MRLLSRVVLGLDQGAATGWGIAQERGPVVRHGLASGDAQRIAVVKLAIEFCGGDPDALFVLFEQHDHMDLSRLTRADRETQRRGPRQAAPERPSDGSVLIGMGKNYGVWIGILACHGVKRSHLLEVKPHAWRSRVHGVLSGDVKQAAIDWASRQAGEPIADHNEAEGYCLTAFAALDGLARYDAEKAQARMVNRAKKAAASQGDLFGGAKCDGEG
jgi:hypothetical protein